MVAAARAAGLVFERHGTGTPVVFLHGLTFDRTSWHPIVERLGDGIESVLVDLPGHGDTPGPPPATLDALAERVQQRVRELQLGSPVVVGHSMSGGVALIYASRFPTCGVVTIDAGAYVQPFATLVRTMEAALRGDSFARAFEPFEKSIGIDALREPIRARVVAGRRVRQDLVLAYWSELFESEPAQLQALIDETLARIEVPVLALFGQPASDEDRTRFARMATAHLEEWPAMGHLLHLADVDRFASRLQAFLHQCADNRS